MNLSYQYLIGKEQIIIFFTYSRELQGRYNGDENDEKQTSRNSKMQGDL